MDIEEPSGFKTPVQKTLWGSTKGLFSAGMGLLSTQVNTNPTHSGNKPDAENMTRGRGTVIGDIPPNMGKSLGIELKDFLVDVTDPGVREGIIREYHQHHKPASNAVLEEMIHNFETRHLKAAARERKSVHEPLMDGIDGDLKQSLIDFSRGDFPDYMEEVENEINAYLDKDRERENLVREYQKRYPYAHIKSVIPTHMDKIEAKRRAVYDMEKPASHAADNSAKKVFQRMQSNGKHHKKRMLAINSVQREIDELDEGRGRAIADGLAETEADAMEMLIVMGTKSASVAEMRNMIQQLGWIVPTNATATSISEITRSIVNVTAKGHGARIVPGTVKIDAFESASKMLGFSSVELLQKDIELGVYQKNLTDIAKILKGDMQDEEFKGGVGLNALLADIQNRDAQQDIMENGDVDNIDVSECSYELEDNMESQDEDNIQKTIGRVTANQKARLLMPLKYSSRFTYKITFLICLNISKIQLAFGRTLPNRGYTYLVLLGCDPDNDFGLRHDKDSFMLHIGGVGLLEKSTYFDETHNLVFRRCYKTQGGNKNDLTSMKNLTASIYTALVRLSAKRDTYMELNDIAVDLQHKIDSGNLLFERIMSSNGLDEHMAFKAKKAKLVNFMNSALSLKEEKNALQKLLADELKIKYNPDARTIDDELQCISFGAVYMAQTMTGYARMHKKGNDQGTNWFLLGYMRVSEGLADYFTMIWELFEQEAEAKHVLDFLFPDPKDLKNVRAALGKAVEIATNRDSTELSKRVSDFKAKPISTFFNWADSLSGRVHAENQQVHALVKTAIENHIEKAFEKQPESDSKKISANLDELYGYVGVTGHFRQGIIFLLRCNTSWSRCVELPKLTESWEHQ
jgi:hypothetical protein